ncbi:response regulator receiver sensor signal transduction histidine kinase [[Leptolyngbya] sp. PCC 7376]|uniref:hybrid sensor histidine kinase/response regulator n=1 Tax=[Leptolyngbya] sp. PCC 7376 TaxID=111781 RepID=UPI00029ED5E1|nr:response regulator [[Leptolyngbya] sp. PCC 7376]AFY40668.1 response regulator receiver sensor signal transduction histidine kinase [[Leptolyngbya] sp. PCC 7376]
MVSTDLSKTSVESTASHNRILLVDDNATNLKVLTEAIRGQGWTTLVATDGESALEQIEYAQPNLILLDVMMPGIDGFETCKRLKSNDVTADIPIIFMTALSDTVDKVKGLELGAVDYITKPFQQEEVIARARLHLKLSQLNQTLGERNAELQNLNDTLEHQVEVRTQELSNSLKELQSTQLQLIHSEKMSTLGQLVAGIGHEINNPVGFISGNLGCIENYVADLLQLLNLYQAALPTPNSEISKFIEEIDLDYLLEDLPKLIASMDKGVDRIHEISQSLRILARGDRGGKIPFQVHDSLDSAILLLKYRLKAHEQHPEVEVIKEYGELPEIQCYPGLLNQVFTNLLANAIDAFEESDQGRTYQEIMAAPNQITISTHYLSDTKRVIISLRDNGPGMDIATQQQIFDHLFTTKPVGKGTGLGLSISRQIIMEKHGGELQCLSELGVGTEFTIELPMA